MTPTHPPHDVLERFVLGDLGDHTAAHVAMHLDDCPACANVVRELDPLSAAFASMDDPVVPDGLVEAILAADAGLAPTPVVADTPWTEILAGAAMLMVAAGVAAGGPLLELADAWDRLRVVGDAWGTLTAHVGAEPLLVATMAFTTGLATAAAIVAARLPDLAGGAR